MVDIEDFMIFKLRKQRAQLEAEIRAQEVTKPKERKFTFFNIGKGKEERAIASQTTQPAAQSTEAFAEQAVEKTVYATVQTMERPAKAERGTGIELEDARGKSCEWHPWRSAYAICDYCHRPFCYEDIIESGRGYYCLEDIDKVSETYSEELYARYSSMSFISAGMFMLVFVMFIYFASGQLVYILGYARLVGLPSFLSNLNYSYGSALLGFVLTALGLIAAVFIFIQSKRGFIFGLLTGLASTALFSYQFLDSGTIYMALISVIAFVALILLAYSKVSYEIPEQSLYYDIISSKTLDWSNPGKF